MCPNREYKLLDKMRFITIGVILLGFFSVESFALDSHSSGHSKMDHSKMDHSKMQMNRKVLTEATKKSVILALEANEALHQSFFEYDGKLVEQNARKLKSAIEAINDAEIKKLLNFSKSKLSEIKASNDREVNNKNYHLVSMALIHIINKYDVGTKYNAYSCPMVKMKWVQNSTKMTKINNPYAPNMPHCGTQDSKY